MISYKNLRIVFLLLAGTIVSCTKLHEDLGNTFTSGQVEGSLGAAGTALLLQAAYNDLSAPFAVSNQVIALEENSSDEALVPTRGGDWDDNGDWRVLHSHAWNADHSYIRNVFNNLNRISFDATNVLAFNPSATQAAEARFLRAFSLYYLLDLYGNIHFGTRR